MPSLEKRGNRFRIVFRYQGQKYSRSLRASDRKDADAILSGVKGTLQLLERGLRQIPDGVPLLDFVLSGGQIQTPPAQVQPKPQEPREENRSRHKSTKLKNRIGTLQELVEKYKAVLSNGSMEATSLRTVLMHLKHIVGTLGADFPVQSLGALELQKHIDLRAKAPGIRQRRLSPETIRKEIDTLRGAWNWAREFRMVGKRFPNRGLRYPKADEKPPFQTVAEVERKIALGHLKLAEEKELWDSVFLSRDEIAEVLDVIHEKARHPFIYPTFCFAAHTGARRSEILRLKLHDLNVEGGYVEIIEKKRSRHKRTRRRVPLTPFLADVLREWLAVHPGGDHLFCHGPDVPRSRTSREESTPLTRNEAHDHFGRSLAGTRWAKLRGWHVFRHSFISNLAAEGVDQRYIDAWVGHVSEDMRRRYRHLFPDREQQVIRSVFGER